METLATCENNGEGKISITLWDPTSGTKLLSLRGPPAHPSTLTFIKDEGFAIVESGKPFIHIWQCGHPLQTSRRILCPGTPCAMAISPEGNFIAVAIEEKISIWQVATGRITNVINSAHYRPITVLKFTDDGSYLVSGGQDGMVLAWKLITLVSNTSAAPSYSWSDHSFPVSDIHVGFGGSKATIFSVAADRTVKIYSLRGGKLLMSIAFPLPLTAIVANAAELDVYVGSNTGTIYQIKLNSPPRSIDHHISTDMAADHVFNKHTGKITGLTISAGGNQLASSDETGIVYIWDLISNQAIKTLNHSSSKAAITNISFWFGDPENMKGNKKPTIVFPDVPKLVEMKDDEREEMDRTVTVYNRIEQIDEDDDAPINAITDTAEISRMKAELSKCESINRQLHQFCVDNILGKDVNSKEDPKQRRKKF